MKGFTILIIATACTPQAPATPSFQQDVMPILAANCVRCHGFPKLIGPDEFRLDTFEDVAVTDGAPPASCGDRSDPAAAVVICGAASVASQIPPSVTDDDRPEHPRFPLDDYQIETLENWARTPGRGESRPGNARPRVVVENVVQSGTIATIRTRVTDPDHDLVAGTLRTLVDNADRFVGAVQTGTLDVAWDTTGIAPGDYSLWAHVDDGAQVHIVPVGIITVGGP